jgi:hypothetical protein
MREATMIEVMLDFWQTFQSMNRSGPMAHYDENDGDGNGRPIETRTVTRKGLVESLEIL